MSKPYIQLFRTPINYYFYDANKGEMVRIDYDSYLYLAQVMSEKITFDHNIPNELMPLQMQGYLATESNVQAVKHYYTDYLGVFLNRKIAQITIQLTQNCNFRCKYCVYSEEHSTLQRSHSAQRMSWETAKKAIDFLWEHSLDSGSVNIGFYGGEPLLEFDLLKKCVDYSTERFRGKELTYAMTTNGTLLTDEMIKYLVDHKIMLMISLDGPKEINDKNRVFAGGGGTYDAVMKSIDRLREIAPEYAEKLQISMVINPENDFDCINSITIDGAELDKLGVTASIVERELGAEAVTFSEEYRTQYEYQLFLAALSYFGRYPKSKVSPITDKSMGSAINDYAHNDAVSELQKIDVPSGPCIPGQRRLFINVAGDFFPCERVSETSPAMKMGSLDEGFDIEKAQKILNVGCVTAERCKKCWCFRFCGMCAKKADGGTENLSADVKLTYCEDHKAMAYNTLTNYLMLKEIPDTYLKGITIDGLQKEGEI